MMRNFYSLKDLVKRIKRQVKYEENILVNNIYLTKDSYLKCIKISQSSILNKTNNPVSKKGIRHKETFHQEDVWQGNKHLKGC